MYFLKREETDPDLSIDVCINYTYTFIVIPQIKGSCKLNILNSFWSVWWWWILNNIRHLTFFPNKIWNNEQAKHKNAALFLDYGFYCYFYSSLLCIVNFSLNDEISKWKPLTWKSQSICTPVYVTKFSQAWPFPFLQ